MPLHFVIRGLAALLVVLLAGCFDAELVLDLSDETKIRTELTQVRTGTFYAAGPDQFASTCPPEGRVITETEIRCHVSFAEPMPDLSVHPDPVPLDGLVGVSLAPAGPGQARLMIDVAQLLDAVRVDAGLADPDGDGAGADWSFLQAELDGHSLTLTVRALQIVSSTGEIMPGGRAARFVVPSSALIYAALAPDAPFVTLLQIE